MNPVKEERTSFHESGTNGEYTVDLNQSTKRRTLSRAQLALLQKRVTRFCRNTNEMLDILVAVAERNV